MLMDQQGSLEVYDNIVEYVEEVKELLSSDLWGNIFLNCTKNEVLIFWLLHRKKQANMSEIADYIHVPLNTATGIIGRMEKSGLIKRLRSEEDKRIVLISLSDKGALQFKHLMDELMGYGLKVIGSLSREEIDLLEKIMEKVKNVLKQEKNKEITQKKIRRITIE